MSDPAPSRVQIDLSPRRIATILSLCVVGLLLIHGLVVYLMYVHDMDLAKGLIPRFYINREMSVPAFFSSTLFLVGAAGFYLMHRVQSVEKKSGLHWLFLSLLFIFLALDETTAIHEMLIEPAGALFGKSGFFFYAWVIPYGLAVMVLGVYLLRPLLALQSPVRTLFFLSAVIYVAGAIGMEMISAAHVDSFGGSFQFMVTRDMTFEVLSTIEESMEMIGLILLIYAQQRFLQVADSRILLRIT